MGLAFSVWSPVGWTWEALVAGWSGEGTSVSLSFRFPSTSASWSELASLQLRSNTVLWVSSLPRAERA